MAGSAKPLAVCVGMGVALLASVTIGRQNQRVWKSMQRMATCSGSPCTRRGVSTISATSTDEVASAATSDGSSKRLLQCTQQLLRVGEKKLSGKTITIAQVCFHNGNGGVNL